MYDWTKMSIGILGAGIENISLVNFLLKNDAKVIVYDQGDPKMVSEKMKDLENPNLMIVAGKDYRRKISHHDIFFRSPGMPLELAKRLTRGKGILCSAMQLFFELCPAKIIGVTGTKGKGTTSALISEILRHNVKFPMSNVKKEPKVYLLGNIGKAQFDDFEQINANDWVVMEMSSFQLEDMTMSPHIAVVLNITPDHLAPLNKSNPNYHKNFSAYVVAKRRLVENQNENDFAVVGLNENLRDEFIENTKAKIFMISDNSKEGCYIENEKFVVFKDGQKTEIANIEDFKVKGQHHLINAQAAIMASVLAGANNESIREGLQNFRGLPHRLQFVGEINQVEYYDDSYATDVDASMAAIKSFDKPIVLICGGSSKGADFSKWAQAVNSSSVKAVIVVGDEAEKMLRSLKAVGFGGEIIVGLTKMDEMVGAAKRLALTGEVILLAPACASFGLFKNASDRGDQFKKMVDGFR